MAPRLVPSSGKHRISKSKSSDKGKLVVLTDAQRLTGHENYLQWSRLMTRVFRSHDLADLIEDPSRAFKDLEEYEWVVNWGKEMDVRENIQKLGHEARALLDQLDALHEKHPVPPETITAFESDCKRRRRMHKLLMKSLSPHIFNTFSKSTSPPNKMVDPVVIWKQLECIYGGNPDATTSTWRQMMDITGKKDFTLDNVIERIEKYEALYKVYLGNQSLEQHSNEKGLIVGGKSESEMFAREFVVAMRASLYIILVHYDSILNTWDGEDMESLPGKVRRFVRRMNDKARYNKEANSRAVVHEDVEGK